MHFGISSCIFLFPGEVEKKKVLMGLPACKDDEGKIQPTTTTVETVIVNRNEE